MSEDRARRIVRERSHGRCETCGVQGTDWAHRRAAGQGGQWRAANGLLQCRPCHAWCESQPLLADAGGWRLVHRDSDPALVPVWLFGGPYPRGWHLLDDEGCVTYVDSTESDLPERPLMPPHVVQQPAPGKGGNRLLRLMREERG